MIKKKDRNQKWGLNFCLSLFQFVWQLAMYLSLSVSINGLSYIKVWTFLQFHFQLPDALYLHAKEKNSGSVKEIPSKGVQGKLVGVSFNASHVAMEFKPDNKVTGECLAMITLSSISLFPVTTVQLGLTVFFPMFEWPSSAGKTLLEIGFRKSELQVRIKINYSNFLFLWTIWLPIGAIRKEVL